MRPPALQIKAERAAALSTWLSDHWAGTDGPELSDLRDQCKQLSTVVESVAFSVHQSMPDLAEFFFGLPRVNRNVLEYLGQVQLLKLPPPTHTYARFTLPRRRQGVPLEVWEVWEGCAHLGSPVRASRRS